MMPSARTLLALGILLALFGPASAFPDRLREAGRAFWQLAQWHESERQEAARWDDLVRGEKDLRRRIAGKKELLTQLLAGNITLPQAAAGFRRLERATGLTELFVRGYQGQSEGERRCRQVIGWTRAHPDGRPRAERDRAIRRLEEELDNLLYCHGTVELPAD
jgi:hypothetical protein